MIVKCQDEELLPLSSIQHFIFCKRQWALIRIDEAWEENYLTAQGRILHDKVDDPWFNEFRKDMILSRSMPLISYTLGLYGVADLVELKKSEKGVAIKGKEGFWQVVPVEYKRGKPKEGDCDAVQLCAQAICIEEMLGVTIDSGEIFYGAIRRRLRTPFSPELREKTRNAADEMHRLFAAGERPAATKKTHCKSCSLMDVCGPDFGRMERKVDLYIDRILGEKE